MLTLLLIFPEFTAPRCLLADLGVQPVLRQPTPPLPLASPSRPVRLLNGAVTFSWLPSDRVRAIARDQRAVGLGRGRLAG